MATNTIQKRKNKPIKKTNFLYYLYKNYAFEAGSADYDMK